MSRDRRRAQVIWEMLGETIQLHQENPAMKLARMLVMLALLPVGMRADAQTLTTLHSFTGGADGAHPYARLVQGNDGNFYGTTYAGGTNGGYGAVFKITSAGMLTTLHSFTDFTDGASPYAGLVRGSDGNFYGTADAGGTSGNGTVFKITLAGTLTTLHSFAGGADSGGPWAGLVQGNDGNFYGTTMGGGGQFPYCYGTVFKITSAGALTTLHIFTSGADGAWPEAGLVQGSDGNFYGTCADGGTNWSAHGTVFKITSAGVLTPLHMFFNSDADGYDPQAELVRGSDGNFYGTCRSGGNVNEGTVFKITSAGTLTTLHSFTGGADGGGPWAGLVQGSDGNFYGTAAIGGTSTNCTGGCGTVFKITSAGTLTSLYSFTGGADGAHPYARLVQGNDGNFYGTTYAGGTYDYGTVFRINSSQLINATLSNVRTSQRVGTKLVDIFYDLASSSGNPLAVLVAVSTNNGGSFNLAATSFSGSGYGSSVIPGNNRQITWNAGADWNNQYSSQAMFQISVSGTLTANSPSTTVDTRNGNAPVVQDVTSPYCSWIQHVFFLNGVSLPLTFTATIDWNGKTAGTVQLITPSGTQTLPVSRTLATQLYDVGNAFGVGGALTVVAVASDGTRSAPYRANFDVINPPTGIPAGILYPVPISSALKYSTPGFTFSVLQSTDEPVPSSVPIFGGSDLGFIPAAQASAEVDGDGSAEADISAGTGFDLKLAGFQVAPHLTGKPEWNYSQASRQWVPSGYIGIGASADLQSPPAYVWAAPPIYFQADLNIDTSVLFGIAGWDSNGDPQLNGEWDFAARVTGAVGCGAADFLSVEGYLGGGPVWTVQYPASSPLKNFYVELDGGARVVCLFYTTDLGALHYEWCLVGCPPNNQQDLQAQFANLLNNLEAGHWNLMARDYLKQPYAVFNDGKSAQLLAMAQAASVPLVLTNIQANVFPYSDPSLAVSGTNQMLVWIWDNPNRDVTNRTELVWSKWNGAWWSSPTSVWDDATADFHPTVRLFPDGSALAAWENERAVLTNGATFADAVAGLEIAVSRFNPATGVWTSTNLTQNSYLDRGPQLAAAQNGKALLTWISNTGNSLLGSSTTQNVVNAQLWNEGSWQNVGPITTNVGMLLWSTVVFNGTNGVFLAVIDGDDDQSTINDQQLYGATFSNSTWSALTQLTSNGVQNAKPQAIYDSTGRLLVAWYQGSNIVMLAGDLNLGNPTIVGTLSGSTSSKDFSLITGPTGEISMIWEDLAADGAGPDPFLLNYDPTLKVWSQPIRLLNNTNELERSFSGAYATNGALLVTYDQVAISVDSNNVPSFGEVDLMYMNYLIGSDLAISSNSVALSIPNPAIGQTVNVAAVVQNIGELAATNVQVAFYNGNPSAGGVLIGTTQTVAGVLSAGSNAAVQANWTVPQTISNQTIYVVVDPNLQQQDRNRGNNTASLTVMAPDLAISSMSVLTPSQTNRVIDARVLNTGVLPVGNVVNVAFYRGATNGALLATVPIADLAPNDQYDASFAWDLSTLTFTSSFEIVYAIVDPGNTVSVFDTSNKVRVVSVPTAAPLPPLGLTAAVVSYNQIILSWSNTAYTTGFRIERSVNGGAFSLLATSPANATNQTDSTVGCGNTYTYRIVATNSFGVSDYSYIAPVSTSTYDSEGLGVPDCWRVQYFGHPAAQASDKSRASDDADGTGQNNLFKYVAGLNPTNPASVFVLNIASVTNQPSQNNLFFTPLALGRTYTPQFCADLVSGAWSPLTTYAGPVTNGSQVSIVDTNPIPPQEFYRIQISLP